MNKSFYFIISLVLLKVFEASAQDVIQHTLDDLNCPLTPQIIELKPQPEINSNNNLRRFTGSPDLASGDLILIKGQVLDSNCVPISDAVVEIWQADSYGNELLNADYEINPEFDKYFVGSGKTITDNMGNYHFLSIMPGSHGNKEAPSINFTVKHRDFLPFETKMYFENQSINSADKMLNKYVENTKKLTGSFR